MGNSRSSDASLVFIVHSNGSPISLRRAITEVWSGEQPADVFSVRLESFLPQNGMNLIAQETAVSSGIPRSLVSQPPDRNEI